MPILPAHQARHCTQLKGSLPWRTASALTVGTVGLLSKIFLYAGHRVSTPGQADFMRVLEQRQRPIITISNHISVMDDPLLWGMMPLRSLYNKHNVRWSLGSADICFTNKVLSTFFSLGQTLPTYRHGVGIFQSALDDAIKLLAQENAWLHVFPEGRIRQDKDLSMRYFKWGVSRIILETATLTGEQPIVVPLFIEGFDQVMHESRTWPRFLPRLFKQVRCTYGKPIDEAAIQPYVDRWRVLSERAYKRADRPVTTESDDIPTELVDGAEAEAIRRELTKVLRDAVGELRTEAGYPPEHPLAHDPVFYDSEEGLKYDELSGIPRPEIFKQRPPRRAVKEVYEKEGPN